MTSTQRSYRKEAERLLLWSVLVRQMPLSSLGAEDVQAFRHFLEDPPPTWCGPRHQQRWSLQWRPLEGALSTTALRQAMVILRSLFAFLVANRYLVETPFATVELPPDHQRARGRTRCFTGDQWRHLEALLDARATTATATGRRLARSLRWIYETGLGMSEIVDATCGDLRPPAQHEPDGHWTLEVKGRGGRSRAVPVPQPLVDELAGELARCGLPARVDAVAHHEIPVLGRFDPAAGRPRPWSTSGLYQAVKTFLARAAESTKPEDASHLRAASAQWMRRTHQSAWRTFALDEKLLCNNEKCAGSRRQRFWSLPRIAQCPGSGPGTSVLRAGCNSPPAVMATVSHKPASACHASCVAGSADLV